MKRKQRGHGRFIRQNRVGWRKVGNEWVEVKNDV